MKLDNRKHFKNARTTFRILAALRLRKVRVPSAQLHPCHLLMLVNNTLQLRHRSCEIRCSEGGASPDSLFRDLTADRIIENCRRFETR
jgi:hypothetical protein